MTSNLFLQQAKPYYLKNIPIRSDTEVILSKTEVSITQYQYMSFAVKEGTGVCNVDIFHEIYT